MCLDRGPEHPFDDLSPDFMVWRWKVDMCECFKVYTYTWQVVTVKTTQPPTRVIPQCDCHAPNTVPACASSAH